MIATEFFGPDDAAMLKLHDRMNVALLECERALGIEKADGTIVVPLVFEMHSLLEEAATLGPKVTGNTSDGYHTFNELYHHRAVLFSVIVRDHRELAWKSMRHHDGTMYDGMFIVGIETPEGQATYHYDIDPYWDMFNCKELDQAPEWDGHTPSEAIERIATLGSCNCSDNCTNGERTETCHDLVHVVRCRDCKYYSKYEWIIATDVSDVCHFWHGEPTKVEPDGFCAWGERRESE